jgi:hypothetical protein
VAVKRGDRVCVHGWLDSDPETPRHRLLDDKPAVIVTFDGGISVWIDATCIRTLTLEDGA